MAMLTTGLLVPLQLCIYFSKVVCIVESRQIHVKIRIQGVSLKGSFYSEKTTRLVECVYSCTQHPDCRSLGYNKTSATCRLYTSHTGITQNISGSLLFGNLREQPGGRQKIEDVRRNHAPAFTPETRQDGCNDRYEDQHSSNPLHLTTDATRGSDQHLGHVNRNISLHHACAKGMLCTVQFILSQRPADINIRDKLERTPVMAAVMKSQVKVFDFLVSQNCDLMAVDAHNDTVLHLACEVGNLDIVRTLVVNHTCDIESRGEKGMTPAMKSALHGHRNVLDFLVSKGCNVTTLDVNTNNILHVACSGGHVDMVKYVLRKLNPQIESRGEKGRTPVMIVAHSGHTGVFDFLARNGSNLFSVDYNKDNILHVSCIGGQVDMVRHILNETSIDIESEANYGRTPVMKAVQYGQMAVVDFLVSKHCNLRALDDYRDTLLHVACMEGRLAAVKHIILKLKFPIESRGQHRRTAVMTSAYFGYKSILIFLRRQGCELMKLDNMNNNILHLACMGGHVNIVKYIVEKIKIEIDSRGQIGFTPVMLAVSKGHFSVLQYLMSKGCKVTTVNNIENNVLHVACVSGHVDMVKYILSQSSIPADSRGEHKRTPVMLAAMKGHLSVVKHLITKGCKLTTVDISGNNLLHVACMSGHVYMAKYILSHTNIHINSRGQTGRTAVMISAYFGLKSVFMFLVNQGCNVMIVDNNKNNALHLACKRCRCNIVKYIVEKMKIGTDSRGQYGRTPVMLGARYGCIDVARYLVSKGCKLNIKDDRGDTILHMACKSRKEDGVKYILSQAESAINSRGKHGYTPVMVAARLGFFGAVEHLVIKGCNLTVLDNFGNNVLHVACKKSFPFVVDFILSHMMFAIDSKGQYGRTPVMGATYYGRTYTVKLLVKKGCNLSELDKNGNNVLQLACWRRQGDVVKYLMTVKSWSKTCRNG